MLSNQFKKYFFSKILFNFLTWIFVGLAFFIVYAAADRMGGGRIVGKPVEGVASLVNGALIYSTAIGVGVMALFAILMKGMIANLRVLFRKHQRRHVIEDGEAAELVLSEILSQLNGLANLCMLICLFVWLDAWINTSHITTSSTIDTSMLFTTSCTLYTLALIIFFSTTNLEKPRS
jgi:hypothetical protein